MDLDAELPNNFSPKKTQVAYSEPKQNAEHPSKITDLTITQPRGLCHGKKSELESLAEQPIAATDSSQCGLCHDNKSEPESFADQPGIDEEINHPIAATDSSQNQWKMPTPINLNSSGLWQPSKTEVSATTMMNQIAHLHLASPQSFTPARIPFSTFLSIGIRLSSMVHSLVVKVQESSTPKVSCHAFALLAFEPITSTNQNSSAMIASKTIAEI
jgi:hypothetical protein